MFQQAQEQDSKLLNDYIKDSLGNIVTEEELLELQESSILMEEWSNEMCESKSTGGMEEWGRKEKAKLLSEDNSCGWYHGTWQYLQLLNMVAIPRWYPFYQEALCNVFSKNRSARVMISAAADYGMLRTVYDAIKASNAQPELVLYDICQTPLQSSRWYAKKHGLSLLTYHTNILTAEIEPASFDLVVTDEFLTVLNAESKCPAVSVWKKILKPGGCLVTTAMIGEPTTEEQRRAYADRARKLFAKYGSLLFPNHSSSQEKISLLMDRFEKFASLHTRHMIRDEAQLVNLLEGFTNIVTKTVETPGECVNPTFSFQITAEA
ncbi:class I SAM-dependent methyltransferase [Scytonema sp. UIC 10036]|uniref:class I SAM-dependent methyltransferase n=1 Tax=Scytonema sp. UIC 10036 TaxID=2304196 RepID=UPI0012DA7EF6|nr:class I SAM-dependent methyltransferase [Scytonema sp. UIC 10036]MUH00707.1 class I SAM-dependent methyltransferase [Scytonema sp. UIC 10036]